MIPLVTALGCGSSNEAGPSGGNTMIKIQDSPFSDAQAVLVTFSEVNAHRSGGSWENIPFAGNASNRTCDLKKLVGAQDVLGVGSLPEGHYTQIRLVVTGAAIYFDNPSVGSACAATIAPPAGVSAMVDVPSGEVKLNRDFDLSSTMTTITLDFDGDKSINKTGNGQYKLQPVIGIVSVQ